MPGEPTDSYWEPEKGIHKKKYGNNTMITFQSEEMSLKDIDLQIFQPNNKKIL